MDDKRKRSINNSDSKSTGGEGSRARELLGEAAKKIFTAGVTAAFLTEESVRNYLGEIKVPKEILNMILQGAAKSKDEISAKVTNEIVGILDKIDWAKEVSKFAETHKIKVSAEIDFIKKDKK